jgi:PAS domain S-box-containing protein/putative nucleotidyltransferase with HDIG domain
MEKILLALNHRANERLLEECLKNRYAPFSPAGPLEKALLEEDFSLGIVDGPVLQSLRAVVQKRREQEAPLFLPFMLVTSREDLGLASHFLWTVVDEVITTPIDQIELKARVESLLTIRRLSLQLHAQYQRLFDNVPIGLYRTSRDGTILDANPAMAQILGLASAEEAIGRSALDFYVNLEDRRIWQRLMEERGEVTQFRCRLRRCSGEIFWASLSIRRVTDERGELRYYEGSMEDVTERIVAEERLQDALERLRRSFDDLVMAFSKVVEVKDPYTAGHQRRVAQLAEALAREMGFSEEKVREVYIAGLLHDIGKIAVPGEILNKPTRLDPPERAIVEEHPRKGYDVVSSVELLAPLAKVILEHHERMDGSGYPRGLRGEEILIEARILAVADVVEAMAHHRPYRPPLGIEEALREIVARRGILYDQEVVDACVCLFREKRFFWEG